MARTTVTEFFCIDIRPGAIDKIQFTVECLSQINIENTNDSIEFAACFYFGFMPYSARFGATSGSPERSACCQSAVAKHAKNDP